MNRLSYLGNKLQLLCSSIFFYLAHYCESVWFLVSCFYNSILLRVNPFLVQFFYFLCTSILGFWILRILKTRVSDSTPRNLDMFFTSVSAVTTSSMSTVEMEVFSNMQLIFMTFLMFIGGEVFLSMVGLYSIRPKFKPLRNDSKIESVLCNATTSSRHSNSENEMELDIVTISKSEDDEFPFDFMSSDAQNLKYHSFKFLGFVALVYLLVIHILGFSLLLVYLACVSSAKDVLRNKGIKIFTFIVFTVVSNISSCGFVPTNESMMVFSKNSGLLLILIPLILLVTTLYPTCLRFSIRFLGKLFSKKREANYLLKYSRERGHLHLLPSQHSRLLMITVLGFIMVQWFLFCSLEWNSAALNGLNGYQKVVGSLFLIVNVRHTGESIMDISTVAPAILVVCIVMMEVNSSFP